MSDEDERSTPGTAEPARLRKAACGIRFDEGELQEGIDFSGAADLKPAEKATAGKPTSGPGKDRKADRHP